MRRALRVLAIASGIISTVSIVVLGYMYLEEIAQNTKKIVSKISNKVDFMKILEDSEVE